MCLVQGDKPLESFDAVRNGDTIEASFLFGEFPATPILPSHVLDLTLRRSHQATVGEQIQNGDTNPNVLERLDCLKKWTKGELDKCVNCETLCYYIYLTHGDNVAQMWVPHGRPISIQTAQRIIHMLWMQAFE